ncbi:twitching motility protein PilT [Clostridia bacterium]|nr:twitching motility protein PilT [Clostridia bacterium]
MTYALDTNTLSFLLRTNATVFEHFENAQRCVIPPVAYYEIKRGLLAVNATAKLKLFYKLCEICEIGEMSARAWDIAAEIYVERRKIGKTVEDADIFIAAFCLANGYSLVTGNTRHFEEMEGLAIEDWTK